MWRAVHVPNPALVSSAAALATKYPPSSPLSLLPRPPRPTQPSPSLPALLPPSPSPNLTPLCVPPHRAGPKSAHGRPAEPVRNAPRRLRLRHLALPHARPSASGTPNRGRKSVPFQGAPAARRACPNRVPARHATTAPSSGMDQRAAPIQASPLPPRRPRNRPSTCHRRSSSTASPPSLRYPARLEAAASRGSFAPMQPLVPAKGVGAPRAKAIARAVGAFGYTWANA